MPTCSSTPSFSIHAIPGFLGLPTDWEICSSPAFHPHRLIAYEVSMQSQEELWTWAERFNAQIQKESISSRILMGYSMGGRLAMHALLNQPGLWAGAILISSHPGLISEAEKKERQAADAVWAERFERDPWKFLMQDWEGQPVFKLDSFAFKRAEKDYNRLLLSSQLKAFSLGKQSDLRAELQALKIPILWVAGERDLRYRSIAESMGKDHLTSQVWIASDAGHRVPWQQTFSFTERVSQFLTHLESSL